MTSRPWAVKLEEPANSVIAGFNLETQHRFLQAIGELEFDPYTHQIGGNQRWSSRVVAHLTERGYPIRRIKAKCIGDWRVFYFVSKEERTVVVKEIVLRTDDDNTYGSRDFHPQHVKRILENFRRFFQIVD